MAGCAITGIKGSGKYLPSKLGELKTAKKSKDLSPKAKEPSDETLLYGYMKSKLEKGQKLTTAFTEYELVPLLKKV